MSNNIPDTFWREYALCDELDKDEKLKLITARFIEICKEYPTMSKIKIGKESLAHHTITLMLKSYFDDLLNYTYTRVNYDDD